MKVKLSISVDERMVQRIEEMLEEGFFRNKSHVFEYSVNKFLREKNGTSITIDKNIAR